MIGPPDVLVFSDLARTNDAHDLPVHIDSPRHRVAMIALRRESEALIVIANLESESVDVEIKLPSVDVTVRLLDERTYDVARRNRTGFVSTAIPWSGERLHLLPFAIATLEMTI